MPPSVGVIVPLFNKEESVQRAIASVLVQSFRDFELVVVDDGSTDAGPDIVRAIPDGRIKLSKQENAGPGGARNSGVASGTYEILAFLDADDEWFPGYLERSVGMLVSNPECAAVVHGHTKGRQRIDSDDLFQAFGKRRGVWRLPADLSGHDLKRVLNAFHTSSSVCRRSVFDRYGGFYAKNNCRWGEDAYFWLQVILNHPVIISADPGAWYHTEDSGLYWNLTSVIPAEPALLDSEPLWTNCPAEYRTTLRRYLALQALLTVQRLTRGGDFDAAGVLLSNTELWSRHAASRMKAWTAMYSLGNRIRWHLPRLHAVLSTMKQMVYGGQTGFDAD